MAKNEEEKFDIEDIEEPDSDQDLDLEEAVSEEERGSEEKKEPEKDEKPVEKEELPEESEPEPEKKNKKEEAKEKPIKSDRKPSKNIWKIVAVVAVAVLIAAALTLAGVWWFTKDKNSQKQSTETTKKEEKIETPTPTPTTKNVLYVNSNVGLKLRQEPTPTGKELAVIPYGTSIDVLETQGDWTKTTYQNQTGWVKTEFTSKDKPFDADWKTYSGSGFWANQGPKFTIKYPSDWTLNDYKITKTDAGIKYSIAFGEGGHGLNEGETDVTSSQEKVTYNGWTATKTTVKKAGETQFIGVNFEKNPTYPTQIEFWVPSGYNASYLDIFEKILSTFNYS